MREVIKRLFRRGWLIKLGSTRKSYLAMLERLKRGEVFSFSRWGDGEWEAVLGIKDQSEVNCDGHQFFDSMKDELQKIIIKKVPYILGMQRLAYHKMMGKRIDNFLEKNLDQPQNLWWVDADVFHDASLNGTIPLFFEEMKNKRVLLVGPKYLRRLKEFPFELVEVPQVNAWTDRDRIMSDIKRHLDRKTFEVVLFCAGMTSNWLVDQLHGKYGVFILDIGSLLDPFAGKTTRNYHRKLGSKYNRVNA